MDDAALAQVIRGAQRGEAAAYDRLVDAFAHRLIGFLHRQCASRHDAEDLLQEVFLRVVRTIGSYHHDGRFEPWLFRIAANLARDRIRRARRSIEWSESVAQPEGRDEAGPLQQAPANEEPADAALQRAEEIDALGAALRNLSQTEREVILLRHFSQMSFREIAELLGVPLGTALARGHRGLARLRKLMNAEEAGPYTLHVESRREMARR